MKKTILSIMIVFILNGCAAPAPRQLFTPMKPQYNESIVYYYRQKHFLGSDNGYDIKENGRDVVKLHSGEYYPHVTTAGYKEVNAGGKTKAFWTEGGKTYFVRGQEQMGLMKFYPTFKVIPSEQALQEIKWCKKASNRK